MGEPQLTYKVSWVGGSLVAAFALIGDLLQVLLSLTVVLSLGGDIIAAIVEGIAVFYFAICGVPFMKGKRSFGRLGAWLITTVIELVPLLDALPTLTLGVIFTIYSSRKEDREAFEIAHAEWEAAMQQEEQRNFQIAARDYEMRAREASAIAANDNDEDEYQEAA